MTTVTQSMHVVAELTKSQLVQTYLKQLKRETDPRIREAIRRVFIWRVAETNDNIRREKAS